jgi:hypothetical protein
MTSFDSAYAAARRSYELGRFWAALLHAAIVAGILAIVAGFVFGKAALAWIPVTLIAVTFSEWRGAALMKGARRGLLSGVGTLLLPLSVLRPCCRIDEMTRALAIGEDCCTEPSACWAAGAAAGLVMALLVPRAKKGKLLETALGMVLGVTSVAVVRCSILFAGEAVGLLGGMAAVLVAASLARSMLEQGRAAA